MRKAAALESNRNFFGHACCQAGTTRRSCSGAERGAEWAPTLKKQAV